MAKTKQATAFILGGGGARGALQVGALRALLEAGIQPDMLVGTSIGAANAAFLAIFGPTPETLHRLERSWRAAAEADLLPANYLWLTIRLLFNRAGTEVEQHIRDYLISQGLDPALRFGDLTGPRLFLVAADLKKGDVTIHGTDPTQSILEGVLASTAIPPWVRPLEREDHLLVDGGLLSNLPIEPALSHGATEIIALDLADPRPVGLGVGRLGPFLFRLLHTLQQRQIHLEKQLAAQRGVPVHHIKLQAKSPVAVWEFPRAISLFEPGYEMTKEYLAAHPELGQKPQLPWWRRLRFPQRRNPEGASP